VPLTHPVFQPRLFRLLLLEDGLDTVGQGGGVGHVQVARYPDDGRVAVVKALADNFNNQLSQDN
jgi:hypothetical protein